MAKVKICGISRPEDVECLNIILPDYVGFVFAPSKRTVSIETAISLIEKLDKRIKTVGVFVDESIEKVREISQKCNLDVLQFHGDETPEYCDSFEKEVWKGFRISSEESLIQTKRFSVDGILLDAFHPEKMGGSGLTFDWQLLKKYRVNNKLILAGGLTPENVLECIKLTSPDIVDVSSGVETGGKKDPIKINNFVRKVRERNE